jgi:Second Messenger Oligonucleotide or Dinucleotide Synthetase domain
VSTTPQPDLRAFVAQTVNLDPERLANVLRTVNHLKEQLQRHVSTNEDFALVEILNSGSVEKKTAITPLDDIDVAVLLRPDTLAGERPSDLLQRVRELLIQVYHPKSAGDYTLGRHAVRIRFRDRSLDVDVVPLIPDPGDERFGLLSTRDPDDDEGEWVRTSIPLHVEFIRERIREHPGFLELVRLTKWWRNHRKVHFKSFLIELLWAHVLDTRTVPGNDLGEALLGFFGYVVRTGLQEPVSFKSQKVPETMTDPVRVLDPVSAQNNVAARITESRREELVSACRQAFEALAAAQTAPTAAVARAYYRRVFGPAFTLPPDTPGEPTSPTAKDHVKAKIRADLRQLRVLNGGFDAASELRSARSIALWIDRGLAATIELAYSDPSTRERRFSLRYMIDQDGVALLDDDPAGIPVRALDGTRFNVRVTGTDGWSSMGDEAKAAFYEELGGWGPAEPLVEDRGRWVSDHLVYALGRLAATRLVYLTSES